MPLVSHVKITNSDVVYSGFNRITKYEFEFSSFDGKTVFRADKEIFERKSAVAVLMYDPDRDRVVLIQQFRPGCFVAENIAFPLEIPAGLIDADTAALEDVARKEAKEETHYDLQQIIEIGRFFPEISFSSRTIHLFCAKIDSSQSHQNGGLAHEGEDIKISLVSVEELRRHMEAGEIINSHTLIAVQWFFLSLENVRATFATGSNEPG